MKLTKQPDLSLDDKSTKIEKTVFMILLAAMAVYYGYRLFAFTPWYDELYTYYCFISKGPIYAAIHWPLPNNHVGYSVLSACLDYLGNAYIGLRGVSYLCALANICILHRIGGIARTVASYLSYAVFISQSSLKTASSLKRL